MADEDFSGQIDELKRKMDAIQESLKMQKLVAAANLAVAEAELALLHAEKGPRAAYRAAYRATMTQVKALRAAVSCLKELNARPDQRSPAASDLAARGTEMADRAIVRSRESKGRVGFWTGFGL